MLDSKIIISQSSLVVLKCEILSLSQIISNVSMRSISWTQQCSSEELKCSTTLGCFTGFKEKGIISFRERKNVTQGHVKGWKGATNTVLVGQINSNSFICIFHIPTLKWLVYNKHFILEKRVCVCQIYLNFPYTFILGWFSTMKV